MGFIENPNSPLAALQVDWISIAGLVGTIVYQMNGSAGLVVVRTVVELAVRKIAFV